MKADDLTNPDNDYYRDNLLSLLKALELLNAPLSTGDWYYELVNFLEQAGANPMNGNRNYKQWALDIYTKVTEKNLLEVMALIDDGAK